MHRRLVKLSTAHTRAAAAASPATADPAEPICTTGILSSECDRHALRAATPPCPFCKAAHVVGVCCCTTLGAVRSLSGQGTCPACRAAEPSPCCGGTDGHLPACPELAAARAYGDQLAMKRRIMKRRYLR